MTTLSQANDASPSAEDSSAADPPSWLLTRLSVMMFLQYFIQGCYLPIVSVYLEESLGFDKWELGVFGSALALGPLFAPFLVGQLVDRTFATERVLAVCHLAGGIVMLALYSQRTLWPVIVLGTLYSLLYLPSLMLTNSLAFHHLGSREKFPLIRLWGTIGFILPAWLIERVLLANVTGAALERGRGVALAAAGVAGLVMTVYSLTLPHTPPSRNAKDRRQFAPAVAMGLLRYRNFLVLVVISFFAAIIHKFHFVLNSPYLKDVLRSGNVLNAWEGSISSLGQVAEIGVMALLAVLIARLGFKWTIFLGLAAYAARCALFALAVNPQFSFATTMTIVCIGQTLHGFCFGCFMAAAFIYLDAAAPADVRGSVQTLYGTLVLGAGFFAGGIVSGQIASAFQVDSVQNWPATWLSGAAIAAACAIAFALAFPATAPEISDGEGQLN